MDAASCLPELSIACAIQAEVRAKLAATALDAHLGDHACPTEPKAARGDESPSADDRSESDSDSNGQDAEAGGAEVVLDSSASRVCLVTSDFPMQVRPFHMPFRIYCCELNASYSVPRMQGLRLS